MTKTENLTKKVTKLTKNSFNLYLKYLTTSESIWEIYYFYLSEKSCIFCIKFHEFVCLLMLDIHKREKNTLNTIYFHKKTT